MSLAILKYPNESLRKKSREMPRDEILDPKIQDFFDQLNATMQKEDGVGLAASQVDKRWRVFSISTDEGPVIFINPKLTAKSWRKETDEEGCLSVPRVYGLVKRPRAVKMEAITRNGEIISLKATGLMARVIQHEIDHLDGILFIDKVTKITRGEL